MADTPKVESPKQVAKDNASNVKTTNDNIEKAGEEATSRLKGQTKERFNVTDAVLGENDQHGIDVRRAQAATFGEDYDPKSDPEINPPAISPAPSQNQNSLKHPDDVESNDPHTARNYLGQRL